MIGDDFQLEASNYASSFDSQIYPGRHVPDVCGLVGMQPRGIYIMLPVEPNDSIDSGLAGGNFPNRDETAPDDGWAVISGTSAASPQIAGVCALLKQVQPGLSPALVKAILRASARDVTAGQSNNGQPAGEGHDGATGAGLVDAHVAYQLARSVAVRNLAALPSPR
jgi:subtilisin family serine protease